MFIKLNVQIVRLCNLSAYIITTQTTANRKTITVSKRVRSLISLASAMAAILNVHVYDVVRIAKGINQPEKHIDMQCGKLTNLKQLQYFGGVKRLYSEQLEQWNLLRSPSDGVNLITKRKRWKFHCGTDVGASIKSTVFRV